jgi:hypothetical protein
VGLLAQVDAGAAPTRGGGRPANSGTDDRHLKLPLGHAFLSLIPPWQPLTRNIPSLQHCVEPDGWLGVAAVAARAAGTT